MIRCAQCGVMNMNGDAGCWNCRAPFVMPTLAPPQVLHRIGRIADVPRVSRPREPGWWQVSYDELNRLGRAHNGLKFAFRDVVPTQELIDHCYAELRAHGIEPLPTAP